MTVAWKLEGDVFYLTCSAIECQGRIACVHTYDYMTSTSPNDLQVPVGKARLPMAAEFPNVAPGGLHAGMTAEKLAYFEVEASEPINDYGSRKILLPTHEHTGEFLMMLNPEDAIVSIYESLKEFVNNQVTYKDGDKFGNCQASSHKWQMQLELQQLTKFVDRYPMLKFWDLLSKLQTGSCAVCMWKRSEPIAAATAADSGLGVLDMANADLNKLASQFPLAVDDSFANVQNQIAYFNSDVF